MNPFHPALAPLARAAKARKELDEEVREALAQPAWLRPEHRVGDPNAYMRHVLYVDADGDFVITAITWLPGQVSPLHGHLVWCAFGVAEGELTEEQFGAAQAQRRGATSSPRRRSRPRCSAGRSGSRIPTPRFPGAC